jgi:hypothetical protein
LSPWTTASYIEPNAAAPRRGTVNDNPAARARRRKADYPKGVSMMITRALVLALLCVLSLSGIALADESSMPLRSFDRFEFDAEAADGLWAEFLTEYFENGAEVTTVAGRVAYGGDLGELGLVLPYVDVDAGAVEADGMGDMEVYGKWIGHSDMISGGAGLAVSVPTGDDDVAADEWGVIPFGTIGAHLGLADLRAHVGYQEFDDNAPDSWIYGIGLFGPLGDNIALRGEFLGQTFDVPGDDPDPLLLESGVDFRMPLNESDLIFRLNGAVGVNDDAPDWGLGGSIVLAWRGMGG